MRVRDCMRSPVHTVKPLESVEHARALLERYRINQLPVMVDGRLVGIVTDRDLRDAFPSVIEFGPAARRRRERVPVGQILIEDVMSNNVVTRSPDDSVEEAAVLMRRERIGAVPVVEHGRLVGILTRSDLLDAFVIRERSTLSKAS
jgi:acetoin utilization protein AcuB